MLAKVSALPSVSTPQGPVLAPRLTPQFPSRPYVRACSSHKPEAAPSPGGLILAAATSICLLMAPQHTPVALAAAPAADSLPILRGPARVVDGDTLYIGQEKIRLYGVDAPEKGQECKDSRGQPYACGLISKDKLLQKVGTKTVVCETKQKDQYQRTVAICSLDGPQPEDLNGWLVQNGLAVAYREYSKDYIAAEDAAYRARKGIWDGTFQYPADWRKAERAKGSDSKEVQGLPRAFPAPMDLATTYVPPPPPQAKVGPSAAQPAGCDLSTPIKGNISAKGERIYHVPGGAYYDRVVIEPEKGEKCFASEADAVKEGFRPSAK